MFESDLTGALNRFFINNKIKGLAYRHPKASRFTLQPCDILSDSLISRYYSAFECKSMHVKNKKVLYFSERFSDGGRKPQIQRMQDFVDITGRKGWLAVELIEKRKSAYILDFDVVYELYVDQQVGIPVEVIQNGLPLQREGGIYIFGGF